MFDIPLVNKVYNVYSCTTYTIKNNILLFSVCYTIKVNLFFKKVFNKFLCTVLFSIIYNKGLLNLTIVSTRNNVFVQYTSFALILGLINYSRYH